MSPKPSRPLSGKHRRSVIAAWQAGLLLVLLAAWQWLPEIAALRDHIGILNPVIVSSPSQVARELWYLLSGAHSTTTLWSYLASTLEATAIGVGSGVVVGGAVGLVLSGSDRASQVLKPFINAVNAVPRIALIPVIVILFGPNLSSSSIVSFLLVFFVVFFNAYEGGRSITGEVLDNARLLGTGRWGLMWRVRLPFVGAWTFAAIPNAVSFGLVGVVTSEILTGSQGIGQLLTVALAGANSAETFSVAIVLGVVGLLLVYGSNLMRKRLLHWWDHT